MSIRNLGIIAHVDAGKTTMTERLLFEAGAIHRTGSVDGGGTVTDFDPEEQKKGITISAATVHFDWQGVGVNLIDTPGHADFSIEVERSLRVLDGAVLLLDGVSGVQPQTEKVWRRAERHGVPKIAFVNKLDRPGASLERSLESLRDRLGVHPVVLGYAEEGSWVDVVEGSVKPPDRSRYGGHREGLLSACGELSESVAEAYLSDAPVSLEALKGALRQGTLKGRLLPVLAGSAAKGEGVRPLLNAALEYLPGPAADPSASLVALCFKVVFPRFGQLTFVRVYGGRLARGQMVWSTMGGRTVRIGRLVRLFGEEVQDVEALLDGDIGAIVGGGFRTGDTLSDPSVKATLVGLETPEPIMHLAIEPARAADREKMETHLQRMLIEDPSLGRHRDPDTGEDLLGGLGQLHLEVALTRLRDRSGLAVRAGRPKVVLRSTVSEVREVSHRHVKQTGGPGQFAEVMLRIEPMARGTGVDFEDHTRGGVIPAEMVAGVRKGVFEAMARGPLGGHPVTDVKVSLLDGVTHTQDSSELAFKVAASSAVNIALRERPLVLLEPVARLEVRAPPETVGKVVSDIVRRRGRLNGVSEAPGESQVRAYVPLAELFGYAGALAALTQGLGHHELSLERFEPTPDGLVSKLLAQAG